MNKTRLRLQAFNLWVRNNADRNSDACAFADNGRRQAVEMAEKEGDAVKSGDVIAEIETDKATMEVEAVDEGVIGKLLIDAGTEGVKVNAAIAILLQDGEALGAAPAAVPATAPVEAAPVAASAPAPVFAAPVSAAIPSDPAMPAGTEMVHQTVREALRDAMAEEMRRSDDVFVMGEEVAEYQGAYKITQGLLQEFGLAA